MRKLYKGLYKGFEEEHGGVVSLCLRVLFVVLLAMSVLFLYLMQRVKSRELDQEITRLRQQQTEAVKNLNLLDSRIGQLKGPERIKPLARDVLGMHDREHR
jgi:cell division protein FtsL